MDHDHEVKSRSEQDQRFRMEQHRFCVSVLGSALRLLRLVQPARDPDAVLRLVASAQHQREVIRRLRYRARESADQGRQLDALDHALRDQCLLLEARATAVRRADEQARSVAGYLRLVASSGRTIASQQGPQTRSG